MDTQSFLNKWVTSDASYVTRDLLLYATSIGCKNLKYIYEFDDNFCAFPTYPFALTFKGDSPDVVEFPPPSMKNEAMTIPGVKVGLDGERYLEMLEPLPPDGCNKLVMKTRLVSIQKRDVGAIVESESVISDEDGKKYCKMISSSVLVGARDFIPSGKPLLGKIPAPSRAPDASLNIAVAENQAHLYRLSGDYNPLHIDPMFAKMSGFKAPILHGLGSLGLSCNAVLEHYGVNENLRFHRIQARFSSPVLPGDTLVIDTWKEGNRVHFVTKNKDTGKIVITNSYVDFLPTSKL
eukprot:m.142951 g.142951  ORF g.142951 m.142951 type:complete len:293 (+) comp14891_c0_seq4:122-1000(+)